jgi:hypothetical protein
MMTSKSNTVLNFRYSHNGITIEMLNDGKVYMEVMGSKVGPLNWNQIVDLRKTLELVSSLMDMSLTYG